MHRGLLIVSLLSLGGCGGGRGTTPLPSAASARGALRAALDAWKGGQTPKAFSEASGKPSVQAVDQDWSAGQKLDSYTIGQETEGAGNKTFAVSLTFKGSKTPKDVRYMVFGTDPIQVYRDEDYARMANMENNPAPPKTKKGR